MSRHLGRAGFALLALMILTAPQLSATMVQQMDLAQMSQQADKIFRGTVVAIVPGTVTVGGAELPTVTYRIEVSETFKGEVPVVKDGVRIAEVTMLGIPKDTPQNGLLRVSMLPDLPALAEGGEYLLMTTQPSALGLSTTVGLGQGCFDVFSHEKVDMAVNQLDNLGLFEGPVAYSDLAQNLREILGN